MLDSAPNAAPALDLNAYNVLIKELMNPDNDIRKAAEKKLDQIEYTKLMPTILQFFESESINSETIPDSHKVFSCTLLKNRLPLKEVEKKAQQQQDASYQEKMQCISQYLDVLHHLSSISVKTLITLFKLFDILSDNLYQILLTVSKEVKENFFKRAFQKMEIMDNAVDPLIGLASLANSSGIWNELSIPQSTLMPHINQFFQNFGQKMTQTSPGSDSNLVVAANNFIKYSCAFISASQSTEGLENVMKILFEVSNHLIINAKMETITGSIVDFLQQIAQVRPRLYKPQLERIIDLIVYIMEIYSSKNTSNVEHQKIKISAMNFMCLLFVDMSNLMMRHQDKLKVFVLHVIDCMAIPDENDEDFDQNVDDDEDDQVQNLDHISKQSEIVFDKMSVKAPKFMFPFVNESVQNFLRPGSSVNQMYAGLNILCCAAEGCKVQYQESLENIVGNFILPYTYDSSYPPRIRFAALTALGQLCSDFGNILVTRLFNQIVDAYSKALLNNSSERVQCHAFAALNNFVESASQVHLPRAIDLLTPTFKTFLQQKYSQKILNYFFNTIISLAEKDIDTSRLYLAIREDLLHISESTLNAENLEIHSKSVLAICSLGQHCDKELFKQDTFALMRTVQKMMQSPELEDILDNIGFEDFIFSWEILVRIFGLEFKEFMPFVLDQVAKIISTVKNSPDARMMDESLYDNFEAMSTIIQQMSQPKDVIMACQLLSTVSAVFKKDVGQYMVPFVDLLTAFFEDEYVLIVDYIYSALMSIIMTLDDVKFAEMWPKLIDVTLNIDPESIEASSFCRMMSAFVSVVESLGEKVINDEFLNNFIEKVTLEMLQYQYNESKKQAQLNFYRENEDFDKYDMLEDGYVQEEDQEEQSYVEGINIFTISMFTLMGQRFMPYFEKYRQKILVYLDEPTHYSVNDINSALNLWIGIVEQCPQEVILSFKDRIVQDLGKFLHDERYLILQTSCFGYGLLAEKLAKDNDNNNNTDIDGFLSEHLGHVVNFLEQHSAHGGVMSGELDYLLALENVISALIRIMRFKDHLLGDKKFELLSLILKHVPFQNDLEELPNLYRFTSELLSDQASVAKMPATIAKDLLKIQIDGFLIGEKVLSKEIMQSLAWSIPILKNSMPDFDNALKSLGQEYETTYKSISGMTSS